MVKVERRRRNEARVELEKERMAAASAAEEAMAMILRLQNEKSCTEIQAKQYRQMAEQKQQYDEVMFRSMQWIIMKHESERSLLEEQLRLYRQKLQQCLKGDETAAQSQEADPSSNLIENCMDDGLDVDPWEPVRPHL
ncbi:protein FLOURY 1-like [Malus domestica]|uniref:protein FLOURY 1-like n=2 Tax=Malus TaxID=3749 RepID=UPI0039747B32